MNKKILIPTLMILILFGGSLTISIRTGSPAVWKRKDQRKDIVEKFKSINEKIFFTQKKKEVNAVKHHQTAPQLSPTELKYRLREKFTDQIAFCGPSVGVINIDPNERFKEFQVIMKHTEEFQVILQQKNLTKDGPWSNQSKQIVIHEHNILSAISLRPVEKGQYKFRLRILQSKTSECEKEASVGQISPQLPTNAFAIEGYIDQRSLIDVTRQEPIFHQCPR